MHLPADFKSSLSANAVVIFPKAHLVNKTGHTNYQKTLCTFYFLLGQYPMAITYYFHLTVLCQSDLAENSTYFAQSRSLKFKRLEVHSQEQAASYFQEAGASY